MDKYLSSTEKEMVVSFIKNEKMAEAVKKVLLYAIYGNGTLIPDEKAMPTQNFALALYFGHQNEKISNETLGEDLRACATGITMLESAFNKMIEIALPPEVVENKKVNNAR